MDGMERIPSDGEVPKVGTTVEKMLQSDMVIVRKRI